MSDRATNSPSPHVLVTQATQALAAQSPEVLRLVAKEQLELAANAVATPANEAMAVRVLTRNLLEALAQQSEAFRAYRPEDVA